MVDEKVTLEELLTARDDAERQVHNKIKPTLDLLHELHFPDGDVFLDEIDVVGDNAHLFFHVRNGQRHGPEETTLSIPVDLIENEEGLRAFLLEYQLPKLDVMR